MPGELNWEMLRMAWQQHPQQEQLEFPRGCPPTSLLIQLTHPDSSAARFRAKTSWASVRRMSPLSMNLEAFGPMTTQFSRGRPHPFPTRAIATLHWQLPTAKSE